MDPHGSLRLLMRGVAILPCAEASSTRLCLRTYPVWKHVTDEAELKRVELEPPQPTPFVNQKSPGRPE
jgi:hypothetical protein